MIKFLGFGFSLWLRVRPAVRAEVFGEHYHSSDSEQCPHRIPDHSFTERFGVQHSTRRNPWQKQPRDRTQQQREGLDVSLHIPALSNAFSLAQFSTTQPIRRLV